MAYTQTKNAQLRAESFSKPHRLTDLIDRQEEEAFIILRDTTSHKPKKP